MKKGIELLESLRDDLLNTSRTIHLFINSDGPELLNCRKELSWVLAKTHVNLGLISKHFDFEKEVQDQFKTMSSQPSEEENYEDMDF